jgi:manganese transport protein
MPNNTVTTPRKPAAARPERRLWRLLGPAFVASIAYVDPGNVAANLTAGAEHGYLLVWVLVASNAMAVLVQYLSAKLGLVTGRSLPEILGERLGRGSRLAYWVQAEVVAGATDVAEVVGGAIALSLLFDLPLVIGGVITGAISMALLSIQSRRGQQPFEFVIIGFLAVIAVGFLAGLFVSPVDWMSAAGGLAPRFDGPGTVVLAASMLGATVMPHAIYLHSALSRDRHLPHFGPDGSRQDDQPGPVSLAAATSAEVDVHEAGLPRLLRATKIDVLWSLVIAGSVNIAMLLLAAASLRGVGGTDTISGAHRAIESALGPAIGVIFAIGLLASGLAATSVGAYAGSVVMGGLIKRRVPLLLRRLVTLIPALLVLAIGTDPTYALVLSQVVLSLGIPFALVPLVRLTSSRKVMGGHVSVKSVQAVSWLVVTLIVALNVALLVITFSGA